MQQYLVPSFLPFNARLLFFLSGLVFVRIQAAENSAEKIDSATQKNTEEWLDRFSQQFAKTFAQYARWDVIKEDFGSNVEGRVFQKADDDLLEESKSVAENVQKFFDGQISSLRRTVETAESVQRKLNLDEMKIEWHEEDCSEFMQRLNSTMAYDFPAKTDPKTPSQSAIHIALESYKCGESVIRDAAWTGAQELQSVMKQNAKDEADVQQFIGTYSGLTRIYPGFRWEHNPTYTVDLFDPRFRPWFVGAETAPKDVLFLIDYSGSAKGQHSHLMKMTTMYILSTLSPNDYFGGIWYNSKKGFVLADCCSDNFLPATTRNKRLFKRYLDKIEEKDQAFLPTAMNMSFAQFLHRDMAATESSAQYYGAKGSGGHKQIILFTDGIEFWPTDVIREFKEKHPNDIIRVFGYSMGRGTGKQPALEWIACSTNAGDVAIVDTISEVRRQSRSFLAKPTEILSIVYREKSVAERPISWSPPYMDVQKRGAVLSLSMPILGSGESSGFAGVAGIDFTFEKLKNILDKFGGLSEQFYAFVLDNNGIVYYHPLLKTPEKDFYMIRKTACHRIATLIRTGTRVQFSKTNEKTQKLMGLLDSISSMDILEIEARPTATLRQLRRRMVEGKCLDGEVLEDNKRQYHCVHIKGTPFSVAFVRLKQKLSFSSKRSDETTAKFKNPSNQMVGFWIRDEKMPCKDELSSATPLKRFQRLLRLNPQKDCVSRAFHRKHPIATGTMFDSVQKWHDSWPNPSLKQQKSLNSSLSAEVLCSDKDEAYLLPPTFDSKYFLSSFAEIVPAGLVTFYPKCQFSTLKRFLHNSRSNGPLTWSYSSPKIGIDVNSNIMTIYKAEYDSFTDPLFPQLLATVGCQFADNFIHEKFQRSLAINDKSWIGCKGEDKRCILVTSAGQVVASTERKFQPIHLSVDEPQLFDHLLKIKIIKTNRWVDYQAECPIPRTTDGRHQFQGNVAVTGAAATPNTRSQFSALTMLQFIGNKVASVAASLIWFEFSMFFRNSFEQNALFEDECQFENIDLVEQCALEHTEYKLSLDKVLHIQATLRTGCTGSLTITPSNLTDLNLFVIDTACDDIPTMGQTQQFLPYQIPDCNLTKTRYRRLRTDLDYTVSHPKEKTQICSSGSASPSQSSASITTLLIICASLYIFLH
ncbi:cache domain-containing protein [Ditylenchus destructor]|uniref:Cache domain-containing protein n=1 Tax=Ditylenchus destructor TaxID=166010 RepID=A0AAD4QZW4_9BILA|nr:cache domain-containing protein [Ditylenchus destructor]